MSRFIVALAALAAACAPTVVLDVQSPPTLPEEPGGWERATVVRVIDGDTIEVRIDSRLEGPGAGRAAVTSTHLVRLIGIDTPESVDPRRPVECFGTEAAAATRALIEGAEVTLVKDVEEVDRFDRLLRYVYLGDEMVNARLVANGYATVYTYPPNIRWSELFVQLERETRENNRGLWAPDTCNGES